MSKADLSLNGLIGVTEALAEAAKQFREFEDRYQANETAFQRIQQQFQQMQESAAQLQSLAEERLASLSNLNVELKARHSQGEQTLSEVRSLLDEIKARQARFDAQTQLQSDKSGQIEQTVGVLQALTEKLQQRQSQLEQSLLAVESLIKDHGKQTGSPDALKDLKASAEQIAQKQAKTEKALAGLQSTQQAEKGLISHFEKALNNVRTMTVELERRQSQTEMNLNAIKASGGDASMVNQQTMGAVAEMMKDIGERQAATMAMIEEARQVATQSAEQVARVDQQITKLEKVSTQAIEGAEAARALAAQAVEKAGELPKEHFPGAALGPEDQKKVYAEFKNFLARCETEHKASIDRESKLQAQVRKTLDGLPARAETALQKFLEQSRTTMDQASSGWMRQQEKRLNDLEERQTGVLSQVIDKQVVLEKELAPLVEGGQSAKISPEWIEAVEAASGTHTSELRFTKTLLWITLAAVGLSYALVAYALILRSS